MGSKIGPVYAILTQAYLEETRLYPRVHQKYPEYAQYITDQWKRCIDDCFLLWKKSIGDINDFHAILNDLCKDLNFTLETNEKNISFLDVMVIKQGSRVVTDIYSKPTDTKQYLHFKSCHARHTKNNIPFSLARRICTIVKDTKLRDRRLQEMTTNLRKRGYPAKLIQYGINKAKAIDIKTLRTPKAKDNNDHNIVTFINTNNPNNIDFYSQVVHRNKHFLHKDPKLRDMLQQNKIINAKRQPPNLKRMLTRAKFTKGNQNFKISKCRKSKCLLCDHIIEGDSFRFKGMQKEFFPNANMNCETENLIYILACTGCEEIYIGETKNLRQRLNLHKSHINNPNLRIQFISEHLDTCGGKRFKFCPLFKMRSPDDTRRKLMESHFISRFNPSLNRAP